MFVENAYKKTEYILNENLNLDITLDCGQAFRWQKQKNGNWKGIVRGCETEIEKKGNRLIFYGIGDEQFADIFFDYFDFSRDYSSILQALSADANLVDAIESYGTIRILRQEPWEALCSFIFSSCNNIPRIKGIIERFCTNFGEKTQTSFSFPTASVTSSLTAEDMAVLRAGFRTPYVLGAAEKITKNEIDLEKLKNADISECEHTLMTINGVGKKVADCTILFGLGHIDAFPVDRHIKRICEKLYPDGLPDCTKGIRGIAQQYMFHLQRIGL